MIVFLSILAATAIVIAIALGVYWSKRSKEDRLYIQKQRQENDEIKLQLTREHDVNWDLTRQLHETSNQLQLVTTDYLRLKEFSYKDEGEITKLEALIKEKETQLVAAQNSLASLEKDYAERQSGLASALQSLNDSRATLLEDQNRLQESILAAQQKIDALHKEKEALDEELKQLCERHRTVLLSDWKDEGELGIRFSTTEKETQLVAAIIALKQAAKDVCANSGVDVSGILSAINKIEWEKVWRPKLQVYRSELAGKQGIYKLTLTEDVEVCYIGQARNIYERWFEHAKKMIGVEPKGNEKLYEYTIDKFYWKVLEEVDDANKLNEAEKYWIDYWCCLEKGLNKKK